MSPLRITSFLAVSVLLVLVTTYVVEGKTHSSSAWNDRIDWVHWDQALDTAKEQNKPVFMLIHKSWCAACKALRSKFVASPEIELLSEHFVMTAVEDDDEPSDEKYSPQGSYSPRIMFLEPSGEVAGVTNRVVIDPAHLHFYGTAEEIVAAMLEALKSISGVTDVDEL